jgi:hypothetical protein
VPPELHIISFLALSWWVVFIGEYNIWNDTICGYYDNERPITVAARSKACSVFARLNTGIVGSNPTRGMISVCVYSVFVLFCVYEAGLRRADSPFKESYRLCTDYKTEKAANVQKGCRAIHRYIGGQTDGSIDG